MRVVFVSNYMNHHQLEVSLEFEKRVDYHFIATQPIEKERLEMGYADMNKQYSFIICAYESDDQYKNAIDLINNADIVIYGSCPFEMVKPRIEANKLTFRYSERLFKNHKLIRMFYPRYIKKIRSECTKYKNNNYYLLCASAYASKDYAWFGAFENKALKWGYFPKINSFDNELSNVINEKQKYNNILWCGRFISFKHPEYVIYCAKHLISKNIKFKINMIGTGVLLENIKKKISEEGLQDYISVLGAKPFDQVQKYMKESKIFLFTSDHNEGWGAVLNESMGNACCVIANQQIGSVPYLIQDGVNGFAYTSKKDFVQKVEYACVNDTTSVSEDAYHTIHGVWCAKNAVANLLEIIKQINNNQKLTINKNNPCELINE